jgi:hypothetical protein
MSYDIKEKIREIERKIDILSSFGSLSKVKHLYEKHEELYNLMARKLNNIDSLVVQFANIPEKIKGFERFSECDKIMRDFDERIKSFSDINKRIKEQMTNYHFICEVSNMVFDKIIDNISIKIDKD